MITIENENYSAAISPLGAELRSFKDKTTGREMMWQADPTVWGGSAPILFPIVGKLRDGQTRIHGQVYEIPKHGLVRTRNAEVLEQGNDYVVFAFSSDIETLKLYPFPFVLEVEFRLGTDQLEVLYRVRNSGTDEMLFSIGSHPAFALNLADATLEDYSIEFSEAETLDRYGLANGLLAKKEDAYLNAERRIALSETLFEDDALIFKNIRSGVIRLKSEKKTSFLEVITHGAPHLGIWAKPGAAYVCIEPWYSFDDMADCDGIFENKPGILRLLPENVFSTGYSVRVVN